jgi:hypothetical protein
MTPRSLLAPVLLAVLALTAAPARALAGADLAGIDPFRGLKLLPRAQLDDPLSFLPKGELAGDPVVWPIAIGQYLASAAVSVGGVFLFDKLSTPAEGANLTADALRTRLIKFGVIQFLSVPLVSATAVWGVGMADEARDPGYLWPLVANYGVELILVGVRLGLSIGGLKGGDAVAAIDQVSGAVGGSYAPVDVILHAVVVPLTVTYFSIRSRGPKGISLVARDKPALPMAVLPAVRDEATVRGAAMMAGPAVASVQLPILAGAF